MLTSRQQSMLTRLIEERGFIAVERFAEEFNISPRTVRHDLLYIEQWLSSKRIELKRDRKKGVCADIDDAEQQRIIEFLHERPEYVDPKLRIHLLLKQLLVEPGLNSEAVLEDYMISRNTLLTDVQEMKEWLALRGLSLIRERVIVAMALLFRIQYTIIIPGIIPHFFSGGAAGVIAYKVGGRKGLVVASLVHGFFITLLPIFLIPLLSGLGFIRATFADSDFPIIGVIVHYLLKLFW